MRVFQYAGNSKIKLTINAGAEDIVFHYGDKNACPIVIPSQIRIRVHAFVRACWRGDRPFVRM